MLQCGSIKEQKNGIKIKEYLLIALYYFFHSFAKTNP